MPEEVTVLSCTVLARQDGKELGRSSVPLYIEGVSQPNSPADWTKNLQKIVIPDGPISGKLMGSDFVADSVQLQGTGLALRSGKDTIAIFLTIKPGKDVYEYTGEDQPGKPWPSIHLHIHSAQHQASRSIKRGTRCGWSSGRKRTARFLASFMCACRTIPRAAFLGASLWTRSDADTMRLVQKWVPVSAGAVRLTLHAGTNPW